MTETSGSILILGATSDIGRAVARAFAAKGHPLMLAARRLEPLTAEAEDLRIRHGVEVSVHEFDALDTASHADVVDGLPQLPEVAVCVVGHLGDQAEGQRDTAQAAHVMRSNYEGPASILGELANRFEVHGRGTLIGIGSVAGDRGRASNYIYGSAKAGFATYLSGLRNRLAKKGVHVMTVKPGFVDTRMTAGMDLPSALTAQPEELGQAIYKGWKAGRDVIYVRRVWWAVMIIIRAIPERVFKRMSI